MMAVDDDGRIFGFNHAVGADGIRIVPKLLVGPEKRTLYRPSLALFAGTNVTDDPFDEIVTGFTVGHVLGKVGLVGGVNFVRRAAPDASDMAADGGESEDGGREMKWFAGVEYSF